MIRSGLYAITENGPEEDQLASLVTLAIKGGACTVQYRHKNTEDPFYRSNATYLRKITQHHNVTFIVNDDVQLARDVGADGVHIGRHDHDIDRARSVVGDKMIIGVSCYNDLDRAIDAESAGADYVAFGSFFLSKTKPEAIRAPVELLVQAREKLVVPVVAIGGITHGNGRSLIDAGAHSLAVSHAVFGQDDVEGAARQLARLFV